MLFTTSALLALMAASATAKDSRTFAVNYFYGNGPLTSGLMDPIVSPGKAASHQHTIMGGSNFALDMSDTTLLDSTCTNSLAKNDKSNYWYPSLFFQDPKDGTFTPVPLFYMKAYYFFEATDDTIKAFKPGHRMLVGNPSLRSPPSTGGRLIQDPKDGPVQPIQWTCTRSNQNEPLYPPNSDGLHGVGIQDPGNTGSGTGFPDKNCDGYASPLRADIHFPSCWNPAAGLRDYKNSMQFPTSAGATGGKANCPTGWVHLPHLFFEVYWNTLLFKDKWTPGQGKQPFVLSNGDPTGYSLHADFISGWDEQTLQQIIDNCDAGNTGVNKCPGLIGGVNDPGTTCNIPAPIPLNFVTTEKMDVKLTALPGNNPVTGWGSTPAAAPAPAPVAPVPPASSAAASSTPPAAPQQPGDSGYGAEPPVAPSSSSSAPAAPISTPPADSGYGSGPAPAPSSAAPAPVPSAPAASAPEAPPAAPSSPAAEAPPVAPSSPAAAVPPPAASSEAPVATPTASPSTGTIPSNGVTDPAGWSFYGCYADKLGGERVLSGLKFANIGHHQVTTSKCIAYCEQRGFTMAGTEYGGQCFCGNSLVGSSLLEDGKCNMPCEGNNTETCGGSLALTVYKKSAAACRKKRRHLASHAQKHSRAKPLKG